MPEFDATVTYRPTPLMPAEFYRVGSDGSVWSAHQYGQAVNPTVGGWRQLKPQPTAAGYRCVRRFVYSTGRRVYTSHLVHRLVLEAFVGPRPLGCHACHYDGDPSNNRADNLRWDTPRANAADKYRHGTQPHGERHPKAKLKDGDILAIRQRAAAGERAADIACDYKVAARYIRSVIRREVWKHI